MVGIDTNILVRYITQDSSEQVAKVNDLFFSKEKIFLSNLVMAETIWALKRCYRWQREEIIMTLEALLEINNLVFEDEASVSHATWAYRDQGDWADHFIQALCKKHHCTSLATFDRKFSKFYPEFVKLLS